jgi:glucose-1-phosphate thymidylyltransferase
MIAVIPAAGEGTRMRPHTHTRPKVLLHVAGKPMLGHILDQLVDVGISRVVLIVGYLAEMVQEYVEENYDLEAHFVVQEELKGLGHAISLSRDHVGNEPCLIIYGDTIFDVDLPTMLASKENLIGVRSVPDARRFGVVEVDGDRIIRMVEKPEKPPSNLAIVGLNLIQNSAALYSAIDDIMERGIRTKGEYQVTDAFQSMIDSGNVIKTFPVENWFDCGKPETLLTTNRHLLDRNHVIVEREGVVIIPPVYISDSAKITHSVIGPYVSIAQGCQVTRCILSDCVLGENSVVEDMILEYSITGVKSVVTGHAHMYNVGDSSSVSHRDKP